MEVRRTIDEIVALYSLEDTIKDIYVEGETDRNFFRWFVKGELSSQVEVYSISDIDVSNDLLDKYNLPYGSNRSRVMAASLEIYNAFPGLKNALFIIDRDYSEYIAENVKCDILEMTDYNSIELYSLNEDSICKLLSIVYGCFSSSPPKYFYEIKDVLREIFSIRLANEHLGWGMEWIDFRRYIKATPSVVFSKERFIEAYLKKNSKWGKRTEFNKQEMRCYKALNEDYRLSIRGHDYTLLLHWFVNKKFSRKKINTVELFEALLLFGVDKESLMEEFLFKRIKEFSE